MKHLHVLALGAIALAPAALHAQTAAPTQAPAAAAAPTAGTTILDSAGATIGTVDSVTPQAIVINTGTAKIAVPPASVGKTATGFAMSMTKADLLAAQAQQQAQAGAAVRAKLVAGTPVAGLNGTPLGTIKAADAQTVTLTTTKNIDVKLPVSGFGAGPTGGVILGMTAAQLDAATAGATPATPAATDTVGANAGTAAAVSTGTAATGGNMNTSGVPADTSASAADTTTKTTVKTTKKTRAKR